MPSRARNNANINYKSEEFKEGINEMPSPKPAKKHPPRPTSPLPVPPSRKAPQPPASSKPVSPPQNRLICPQCTFSNDSNRKTCSVCGASLTTEEMEMQQAMNELLDSLNVKEPAARAAMSNLPKERKL